MATNCLGPHLLTLLLLPCLRAAAQVRAPSAVAVLTLEQSSFGHLEERDVRRPYSLESSLSNCHHTAQAPGASPARVVNVSSRMHRLTTVPRRDPQLRQRFGSVAAYSVSKTAQVGR